MAETSQEATNNEAQEAQVEAKEEAVETPEQRAAREEAEQAAQERRKSQEQALRNAITKAEREDKQRANMLKEKLRKFLETGESPVTGSEEITEFKPATYEPSREDINELDELARQLDVDSLRMEVANREGREELSTKESWELEELKKRLETKERIAAAMERRRKGKTKKFEKLKEEFGTEERIKEGEQAFVEQMAEEPTEDEELMPRTADEDEPTEDMVEVTEEIEESEQVQPDRRKKTPRRVMSRTHKPARRRKVPQYSPAEQRRKREREEQKKRETEEQRERREAEEQEKREQRIRSISDILNRIKGQLSGLEEAYNSNKLTVRRQVAAGEIRQKPLIAGELEDQVLSELEDAGTLPEAITEVLTDKYSEALSGLDEIFENGTDAQREKAEQLRQALDKTLSPETALGSAVRKEMETRRRAA